MESCGFRSCRRGVICSRLALLMGSESAETRRQLPNKRVRISTAGTSQCSEAWYAILAQTKTFVPAKRGSERFLSYHAVRA